MSERDYYAPGDWNAVCYRCARKHKASELKLEWEGFRVCDKCWEPRHPQDFIKPRVDQQTPPWTQPDPAPIFIPFCTPNGQSAYPGEASPGCVKPAFVSPLYDPSHT